MPTVRATTGRTIDASPLPSARLTAAPTAESLGGGLGATVADIGQKMYADEIAKQDQIAVQSADSKLSAWENTALYDPKNGALNKRGQDALGLPDTVNADLDTTIGDIRNSLSNDRQRAEFDRRAVARKSDVQKTITRHVFTEVRKFDDTETENYIANSRQAASSNFQDESRVQLEVERQRDAITTFAARNGLGAEYVKQKIAQSTSDTHVGVIDRMLSGGLDQVAAQYFDKVKGDIAGNDIARVEKSLLASRVEGEAMRTTDEVWKSQGPKSDLDPVNLDAMGDTIRARYANDPRMYKAAMQNLNERAGLHNGSQRERADANEAATWTAITNGSSLNQVRAMPEFLALPGAKQEQIKEHIVDRAWSLSQRAREAQNQDASATTRNGFAAYLDYSNPEKLAAMTENQIVNLLPTLGQRLTGDLMEKHRALQKSSDVVREAKIDDDAFKQIATGAGFKPYDTKQSVDDKATLGRLRNAVEAAIDSEQRATGKPLGRDRKEKIMQDMVDRKVKFDVFGTDPELPAAIVVRDKDAKGYYDPAKAYVPIAKVPADYQSQALNYIRSNGAIGTGMSDVTLIGRGNVSSRIERAYAARLLGAKREQIESILKGQ